VLDLFRALKVVRVEHLVYLERFQKVDQMLDLSEHLKKMVDDERGPCGCDEVSQR
jgi:hypothetical protein